MTILRKIYWAFYPKISSKVVYLQRRIYGFHLSDADILNLYGLRLKEVDYNSDEDLQLIILF